MFARGVIAECLSGDGLGILEVDTAKELMPIVAVTDCRSLYDAVQKEGMKLPTDKRLGLELAALKDMLHEETDECASYTQMGSIPLRWLPTEVRLADALTKEMNGEVLQRAISTGCIQLTESPEAQCLFARDLSSYLVGHLATGR